jgi:hypothetical protein
MARSTVAETEQLMPARRIRTIGSLLMFYGVSAVYARRRFSIVFS